MSRPVLLLVADASDPFLASLPEQALPQHPMVAARPLWREPRRLALIAASLLLVAAAARVGVWASARPGESPQASALSRVTAPATSPAVPPAEPAAKADEPAIPLVDVKSLPPAPRR